MFEKLKAKIAAHHSSHPLAKQRAEFLLVTADTPLERKAHFTAEVVGAGAAYQAFQAFENNEAHFKGIEGKVSHARSKEIIVGLAEGRVVKLVEEKRLPFTSETEKVKFIKQAQKHAAADAKRAVRESGLYSQHELEPLDADEKIAAKIM
ncbi:uncharacterized protein L199_003283 [Kwoniella botswanensis]|uniref:uncharacterized protein n=1 Tax=Kwoniella botswanensis TaxID=1268659 RepID=UPI00315C8248